VTPPAPFGRLPEAMARHLDRVCDRYEAALRAGKRPPPDAYLDGCPEPAQAALLAELGRLEADYRGGPDATATLGPPGSGDEASGPPADGRYIPLRDIGAGGMGRVSLCLDRAMGRPVAVKALRPELAGSPEAVARFRREARVTGRLSHPSIVPVYELAAPAGGGPPFYTMRHVEGTTLTGAVRAYHAARTQGGDTHLELVRLLGAFVTACQAVAYAHAQGVLHRDLKGGNIILGGFGEVIVLDWGLAKLIGEGVSRAGLGDEPAADCPDGHTLPGSVTGTPGYMAPEQATGRGDLVGPHTDVYGLGAILYELLTGRPPFVGATTAEVLAKAAAGHPTPPGDLVPDVPGDLAAACLRALAKEPGERHPSAAALAEAVQRWLADAADRGRAREERERFFGLSLDLLCTLGSDGGFHQANPGWEKTLGWPAADLPGRPFADFVHPDDRDMTWGALAAVAAGSEVPPFVNRCARAPGGWRWVSWSVSLIHGEQLVYAVGRDVTEQKEAEAALRRSQERFELAVRGSGVGLWDWDRETGESYYSPRWKGMIGYADDEIPHEFAEWESRVHPDDLERARAALRSCTEGGAKEYEVEYRLQHKDGSYVWILDRGVAICDEAGKVTRMAGSHTDITARKQDGSESG
jgi:PAS domain S-box-containing protein